jgi:signal transduction histidine kinase
VELVAREEAGRVFLRVEDDGRGVASEDVPRLFQPYFTTKPRGTGLGLFVSRGIVAELGGTLTHEHRSPRGSLFIVTLPAAASEPVAAGVLVGEALA